MHILAGSVFNSDCVPRMGKIEIALMQMMHNPLLFIDQFTIQNKLQSQQRIITAVAPPTAHTLRLTVILRPQGEGKRKDIIPVFTPDILHMLQVIFRKAIIRMP